MRGVCVGGHLSSELDRRLLGRHLVVHAGEVSEVPELVERRAGHGDLVRVRVRGRVRVRVRARVKARARVRVRARARVRVRVTTERSRAAASSCSERSDLQAERGREQLSTSHYGRGHLHGVATWGRRRRRVPAAYTMHNTHLACRTNAPAPCTEELPLPSPRSCPGLEAHSRLPSSIGSPRANAACSPEEPRFSAAPSGKPRGPSPSWLPRPASQAPRGRAARGETLVRVRVRVRVRVS